MATSELKAPPDRETGVFPRYALPWAAALVVMMAGAALFIALGRPPILTVYFFLAQDAPLAFGCAAVVWGLGKLRRPAPGLRLLAPPPVAVAVLAACALVFAGLGARYIYDGYALSLDEFMVVFDSQILRTGQLAAPVAQDWQAYLKALQPSFILDVPSHTHWVSAYLPVNAGFRALASVVGAEAWLNPAWVALSVLAIYGVARRLWPEQQTAALVAAALLATAPQVLITAMTPYAMTAHMALNLCWLWLVLRGGRAGHAGAIGVAFLATGLHQFLFHPLFAAPFVLEMWLARRWRVALLHTLAYGAILAFWMLYPAFLLHALGPQPVAAAAGGDMGVAAKIELLMSKFDLVAGLGVMAMNLVRFFTWQSLVTLPLALFALWPALCARGTERALAVSLCLTLAVMLILIPYQGHGWGYRYLHGLLGPVCLLAAAGWIRLSARQGARATAMLVGGLATTVLVLLPVRAWQAHGFVHPYAAASREIHETPSRVVLIDPGHALFAGDFVRNDPFLTNGPIVLNVYKLSPAQRVELCHATGAVVYGPAQAEAQGVIIIGSKAEAFEEAAHLMKGLVHAGCRPWPATDR